MKTTKSTATINKVISMAPIVLPGQSRPVVHGPLDLRGRKAAKEFDKKAALTNDILVSAAGMAVATVGIAAAKGAGTLVCNGVKALAARRAVKKAEATTPEPTATATPEPTATATPEPTATATPEPTATDSSTTKCSNESVDMGDI